MNKKIKTVILLLIFAAVMTGAVCAYNILSKNYKKEKPTPSESASQKTNQPVTAPDFIVYDGDGNETHLSDFSGKNVVINFWATWCPPCVMELPYFDEAYKKYGDSIEFMMVNLTDGQRETKDGVLEFIKDKGYSFPVYYDTEQIGAYMYSVYSVPLSIFVNTKGEITNHHVGAMSQTQLDMYIKELNNK